MLLTLWGMELAHLMLLKLSEKEKTFSSLSPKLTSRPICRMSLSNMLLLLSHSMCGAHTRQLSTSTVSTHCFLGVLPAPLVRSCVELSAHMFKRAGLKVVNKLASLIIELFHVWVLDFPLTTHLLYDQLRISLDEKPLHHPRLGTECKTSC